MHHHKRHKYDIIVLLAVIGLSVSLYLAITKAMGVSVPCGLTKGCETVLSSKYSSIFGIDLALLGILFYSGAIGFALLANHYTRFRKILTWYLGLGMLSALYFLGIQLFAIGKFCQYCLVTDSISILLLLWDLNIEHKLPAN
jgi:uncharacterized membrane protein